MHIGRPKHLTSEETYAQVAERVGKREITDAAAVTIASWWADPRDGLPFAELSTAGYLNVERLTRAISLIYTTAEPKDRQALDMLGTWALNRHREH
jgi:hypothetical protein